MLRVPATFCHSPTTSNIFDTPASIVTDSIYYWLGEFDFDKAVFGDISVWCDTLYVGYISAN